MNWLSRFLHIKPANRALCFTVRRGKVRQELVHLLQDWQRYGVRDVTCDRETNVITARVDKNNRKYTEILFTAWTLENNLFLMELEGAFSSFPRHVASILLCAKLIILLCRSSPQTSCFRSRVVRRTRRQQAGKSVPCAVHANERSGIEFSQGGRGGGGYM